MTTVLTIVGTALLGRDPKTLPESTLHFGPNSNSGYASEPVNTALGNYTYEHTDLKLAGNPGLEFRRAYNSQDGYQGPLT